MNVVKVDLPGINYLVKTISTGMRIVFPRKKGRRIKVEKMDPIALKQTTKELSLSTIKPAYAVAISGLYPINMRRNIYFYQGRADQERRELPKPFSIYIPSILFSCLYIFYPLEKYYIHKFMTLNFTSEGPKEITLSCRALMPLLPNMNESGEICMGSVISKKRKMLTPFSSIETEEVFKVLSKDLDTILSSPWNNDIGEPAILTAFRKAKVLGPTKGNSVTAFILLDQMTPEETLDLLNKAWERTFYPRTVGKALSILHAKVNDLI